MTDRELLELAARAAGLDLEWCGPWACMARNLGVIDGFDRHTCWEPLKDDGDALRLAVKLNINVFIYDDETSTSTCGVVANNWGSKEANTRRAIVRAAAEIGKAMP